MNKPVEAVTFNNEYDKITDTLCWLSNEVTLCFTLHMSRKDKNGARAYYHREAEYDSKYIGRDFNHSIKRQMQNFFLTIEVRDNMDASIMIQKKDMIFAKKVLELVAKNIINGSVYSSTESGEIYIREDNAGGWMHPGLCGKYIKYIPIIYTGKDETLGKQPGIRIDLNGLAFVDLSIDQFMEFAYVIGSLNMYQAALELANYVMVKPDSNMVETYKMSNNVGMELNDRPSKHERKASFFDKNEQAQKYKEQNKKK